MDQYRRKAGAVYRFTPSYRVIAAHLGSTGATPSGITGLRGRRRLVAGPTYKSNCEALIACRIRTPLLRMIACDMPHLEASKWLLTRNAKQILSALRKSLRRSTRSSV